MRLGGRLSAAIDILDDIATRHRPVADALKDWGLSHRFAGSGDRAAIGNIVYDALRKRSSHAWLMDDDSAQALAHAVLFRQWSYRPETLAAELEGDRFAPAPLPDESLAAFASRDLADAPLHVQADMPEWLVPSLQANFGEDWLEEAQALNTRPPLDLRVNRLKADREKVLKALSRLKVHPTPTAPHGIRIDPVEGGARHPNVTAELAYSKGWFEVQDEGSQIVAELVGAGEGEQVLDYCAGGGGKTLALSAAMANKGQIHAYDAERARLAPIVERLKRAGTRNAQLHDEASSLDALTDRMDRVLVDAPCTGSGTWRRRPDTKWRLSERHLQERCEAQTSVLAAASAFVRPGGTLAYVTCSVLPEENEGRITAFLQDRPEFELVRASENWSALVGEGGGKPLSVDGNMLTLTPHSTGTDGFFFAAMRRRA